MEPYEAIEILEEIKEYDVDNGFGSEEALDLGIEALKAVEEWKAWLEDRLSHLTRVHAHDKEVDE